MKYILCFLALIIFSFEAVSQAQLNRRYNSFSGTLVLSVEGGATLAATDYTGIQPDFMGRALLEYFFPTFTRSSFGFRIFGNSGFITESEELRTPSKFRTSFATFGGGVVYSLQVNNFTNMYLSAGGGYFWFDPKADDGTLLPGNQQNLYNQNEMNYYGELGFRFLLTENLSLNFIGGMQFSPNDFWDDSKEGTSNDLMLQFLGGLSFAFFAEKDSDQDGVKDSRDLCPGTPGGIEVDETGCPKDSDRDGVPDYLDKCAKTPYNVKVDEDGCPVDSDNDGISDDKDDCPGTPQGMKVDMFGCPEDQDSDGIPDADDKCPDTPFEVEVDQYGCPKDDDLDGVPDYLDKCPKTPAGEKVDRFGCSVDGDTGLKDKGLKEITLSAGASFKTGSADILPGAYQDLNKLLYAMKENPISRWRIEGYTDNTGSEEVNKRLSLKRAEAVLGFFTSKGISRSRFEVFGYGESNPVASNNTEEGRARNRRVRIVRTN